MKTKALDWRLMVAAIQGRSDTCNLLRLIRSEKDLSNLDDFALQFREECRTGVFGLIRRQANTVSDL